MSLKRFSRAGLIAGAGAILLGIMLSLPTYQSSYAQMPTTAPAAAPADTAAPAAAPSPPACSATVLEKCTPNSGDTAWMLTSMAIVLMMTIPGLALFYGGMVRKKNVGDTVMTSFAITCLISVLWLLFTYSIAFRAGSAFIGGFDRAGLQGILSDISNGIGNPNPLAPTIPESVYSMFQLTFAIITAALIAGSFAERMKFSAMLWFIGLWAIFVYSPIAHWVWGPDGFLNSGNSNAWVKVLDFAGGTVVHVNSGTAGLMAALMLGKRKESGPPHNVVLTMIGASLLWVGWFGFNAGSAVSAGMQAGMAMLVTHTATATAGFTWMLLEWMMRGKPTVLGICSGAVAVWVTSMAMPACRPALVAEPALKPNQPTHKSEAPMKVSTMLWAGPVSLRLPSISAHIRPAVPELTCTTVPPAKSSTLMKLCALELLNMPSGPHTQWATGE